MLLPCDGDLGLFDQQVASECRARCFAAVQAVAQVAAGFGEELVAVDLDGHGFAEAGGFHSCVLGGGSLVSGRNCRGPALLWLWWIEGSMLVNVKLVEK